MIKQLRYKKGEKEKMVKDGFPLCYDNRHCNSCMTHYRGIKELENQGFNVYNHVKIHE